MAQEVLCTLHACRSDAKRSFLFFFFFSFLQHREVTPPPPGARSIPAVRSNSGGTYTTIAKDISPSALQRKRLPFYTSDLLFVRDLASHFHLIPQANTSSYSSLATPRCSRSRSSLRPFYSSRECRQ